MPFLKSQLSPSYTEAYIHAERGTYTHMNGTWCTKQITNR